MMSNDASIMTAGGSRTAHDSHWFLEEVRIGNFGAYSQRTVGPFTDGLNVVYGPNEAGKTTLVAFVEGVLFGWPMARGNRNSYRSDGGQRAGRLLFSNGTGSVAQVSRARNSDGLQGDVWLVEDIDSEIFRILFAWNGDELRSLGDGPTVVSQLLTAGAGTAVSPDAVRGDLDATLKRFFSRAADQTDSIVRLGEAVSLAEKKMQDDLAKSDEIRRIDEEYHHLHQRYRDLGEQLARCNGQIEQLKTQAALVDSLESRRDEQLIKIRRLESSLTEKPQTQLAGEGVATPTKAESVPSSGHQLVESSDDDFDDKERVAKLRSEITDLYEGQIRCERNLAEARDSLAHAQAAYENLQRDDVYLKAASNERRTRKMQGVASIILPILVLIAGVPTFLYGNRISSMTVTAFGVALVVAALFMGVAAIIALVRPNQSDDRITQQRDDARWVAERERLRVQSCEKELSDYRDHVRSVLTAAHLDRFDSSGAAKRWLDERYRQSVSADTAQAERNHAKTLLSDAKAACDDLQERIDGLLADTGASDRVDLDALISHMVEERDGIQKDLDACNHRMGRFSQRLDAARDNMDLPAARQAVQDAHTRYADAQLDYARTLLAYRDIAEAISHWEAESQPAVYRRAGELLRGMTHGEWREIRQTREGELTAVDRIGRTFPPEQLSLGTRQQLYLSLRVALLQVADDLGCNVPVMADDILANFDDERRVSVFRALLQFAETRQVILLTGQNNVVELARDVYPSVNVVTLARTQRTL